MEELWGGDLAVLVRVVDMYERIGAHFETTKLLEIYPAEQHDAVGHSLRALGDDARCLDAPVWDQGSKDPRPWRPGTDPDIGQLGDQSARCRDCDDGHRSLPYQDPNTKFVADWEDQWQITRAEIVTWRAARQAR